MQPSSSPTASDFRLGATFFALMSIAAAVFAWKMFASGGYELESCERASKQALCEIGRAMLAAFPEEYRHIVLGTMLAGVAAFCASIVVKSLRRSDEMVRSGLDDGKGLM